MASSGTPSPPAKKPEKQAFLPSSGPLACSVCLEVVSDGGPRSIAKLKCGHCFHLDCIGSAFNVKGVMQCPNCRQIEDGQWLYANGTRQHENTVFEDFISDEGYDFHPRLSELHIPHEEMNLASLQWFPDQSSYVQFTVVEDEDYPPVSYADVVVNVLLGHHASSSSNNNHPCPIHQGLGPPPRLTGYLAFRGESPGVEMSLDLHHRTDASQAFSSQQWYQSAAATNSSLPSSSATDNWSISRSGVTERNPGQLNSYPSHLDSMGFLASPEVPTGPRATLPGGALNHGGQGAVNGQHNAHFGHYGGRPLSGTHQRRSRNRGFNIPHGGQRPQFMGAGGGGTLLGVSHMGSPDVPEPPQNVTAPTSMPWRREGGMRRWTPPPPLPAGHLMAAPSPRPPPLSGPFPNQYPRRPYPIYPPPLSEFSVDLHPDSGSLQCPYRLPR